LWKHNSRAIFRSYGVILHLSNIGEVQARPNPLYERSVFLKLTLARAELRVSMRKNLRAAWNKSFKRKYRQHAVSILCSSANYPGKGKEKPDGLKDTVYSSGKKLVRTLAASVWHITSWLSLHTKQTWKTAKIAMLTTRSARCSSSDDRRMVFSTCATA